MARSIFVVACLLLVAIWVHPYMSGAFETPVPKTAWENATTTARPVDAPLVHYRGREGFWRLGQSADGVWWFVSPTGQREFLNTVTTVQPFQLGRDDKGVSFVSRDWDGSVGKYDGDLKAWAGKTLDRIRYTGFKGLGAWCHPIFHQLDVPITRDLNLWKHYGSTNFRLYDPNWAKVCDGVVSKAVAELKDNKNLVGYFTDNELDWSDASMGPGVYFDGLPAGEPNRVQVLNTVQSVWPTVEEYNADWGTSLASFTDLAKAPKISHEPNVAYAKLVTAWQEKLARDYFQTTTDILHKYDPNHLVLGVRFAGFAPKEVCRASRGITDAQSLNYYVPDGQIDPDMFKMINAESGQPIILSEYSFHALDGRSGNRNTFGFQAQVPDQQARAQAYGVMTSNLARVPYVIGADWFQWSDEPPSGRSADGEDVDFGMVDVDDRPYQLLADAVRQTTPRLNPLHAVSATDAGRDVYRDTYAIKPTAKVLKLEHTVHVNGELSDWSEAYRVPGVRRTQTIGIDRMDVRSPNLYMGWRDEGLYVAFEVFDSYIDTQPATGRWWTRDNIELWFDTRTPAADQELYDPYCHQFFFVPEVNPEDGRLGTVGQWHRPGDAIKENAIPQPLVRQSTRLMPGKYVVEMFIPAAALHGWDPVNQPEMAFNFHVRNFQGSSDYFWSAPKELTTQMRPDTWGKLTLAGPQVAIAR